MENAIKHLRIQNFKSIKDVTLKPRRVNIIIGEPNVGKSNILEAMSLLGGMMYDKKRRFMEGMVRYERANQLFFDNLIANTIRVDSDREVCVISSQGNTTGFEALFTTQEYLKEAVSAVMAPHTSDITNPKFLNSFLIGLRATIQDEPNELTNEVHTIPMVRIPFEKNGLRPTFRGDREYFSSMGSAFTLTVRPYLFTKNHSVNQEYGTRYLEPPVGDNLKNIIQTYAALRKDVSQLFAPYGLKLLLHMANKELEVIKDLDGVIYSYPYTSMADTLQRLIFYLAAIESNDDAVLLFEEPETHSFPVYVSKLGRRIVESKNNQFFVATHSPYLITEVLEEMLTKDEYVGELAIFAAYYEDYQTKVHQLSDEEIFDIRADGIDVFYNMKRFTTGRENA